MHLLVLGAGLQGSACAFDLLQQPDVAEVRIADLKVDALPSFLSPYVGERLIPMTLDVRDPSAVRDAMRGCNAAMSAIPYYFNLDLARIAGFAARDRPAVDARPREVDPKLDTAGLCLQHRLTHQVAQS